MGNFQSILKSLRTSKKLTQEELAKKLKISRSTIGMYENGSREPDYEMLEMIADFFNVDIDYLLGRTYKTTVIPNQHFSNSTTPEEFNHIKKYRALDDHGKKMVDFTLNEEWERSIKNAKNEPSEQMKSSAKVFKYTKDAGKENDTTEFSEELHTQEQRSETNEEKFNSKIVPIMSEDDPRYVNAAHPIDGASEEDIQFDEDIMDDENF